MVEPHETGGARTRQVWASAPSRCRKLRGAVRNRREPAALSCGQQEDVTMAFNRKIVLGAGILAAIGLATAGYVAVASPPDAWAEFRQNVATKCIALALAGDYEKANAQV